MIRALHITRHPLKMVGKDTHKFVIPKESKKVETFSWTVQLPEFMTCSQCVIQWTHDCVAVGEFAKLPDADIFCHQNCLKYPSYCPEERYKLKRPISAPINTSLRTENLLLKYYSSLKRHIDI
ncbi:hypothetical protein Anas_03122 [Armadillidium nasatum]|uniref:Uncharacterized protein n=1 Tax=Armadillidium nasatum TaxID=96803 RepID=A0A5N5SXW7_9CRUS|nr:hypothetical protein Anas_03122 [Armadillidium nasatum]